MKKIPEKLSDTLISRIQKYIKENTDLSSKTPIGIGVFDLLRKRSKLVFNRCKEVYVAGGGIFARGEFVRGDLCTRWRDSRKV